MKKLSQIMLISIFLPVLFAPIPVNIELNPDHTETNAVLIPAGTYPIGAVDRDIHAEKDEKPAHDVELNTFHIDRYEISNRQFAEFMNSRGFKPEEVSSLINSEHPYIFYEDQQWLVTSVEQKLPVTNVSWYAADAYCQWANGRLPNESEWEAAARGTTDNLYPWGNEADCSKAAYADCGQGLKNVDQFSEGQSPFGVVNMAGNVWEWTADYYFDSAYKYAHLLNPFETGYRENLYNLGLFPGPVTIRGGSWLDEAEYIRVTNRAFKLPNSTYDNVGFRCVYSDVVEKAAMPTDNMVLIPAGTHVIGASENDAFAEPDEKPAHEVFLDDFRIDQYEVNNQSFAAFLSDQGFDREIGSLLISLDQRVIVYSSESSTWGVRNHMEQYPVVNVTWRGAAAFCEWMGKRLPTEAEWEAAAQGTAQYLYPSGNDIDCLSANFLGCNETVLPVGSLTEGVNPFGLYDMAGNVWEWTADPYDETFYTNSPDRNPNLEISTGFTFNGLSPEGNFVIRGGSWKDDPENLRVTNRAFLYKYDFNEITGFRCVVSD